jgi:hypothetical protein
MIIAHKIALDPNAAQESYFACACGTARFACGHIRADMTLSDRELSREACGVIHARDRNGAINLRLVAESSLAAASLPEQSGSSVTACGEVGSDVGPVLP